MNTCTYEYKDYKTGSISECKFREDDLNEINWFFESDNQPTSIVSVKINGQKVSLNEARYVVYQWEQKLILEYGNIDKSVYDNNIKIETERMKNLGVDVDKCINF